MADTTPSASKEAIANSRPSAYRNSSTWLRSLSRTNLALLVLGYITSLHLVGLYVFTQGFLLTRLTIPHSSPPYTTTSPAPFPPTHTRAVILVIDALRTDFLSPYHPNPPSPYHHGVLTLPAELSAQRPDHSLIFNSFSDPPTSTMQRLKGITTGSLPTFIDISSNFASTAIEEDSLVSQLVAANKTVGFMGDDTWANLFPSAFELSHPYDSFNVEDLHTVDDGVIEHLFPYLHPTNQSRWDVLIGHFLGVDHVGHRVTPHRETMRTKLEQMNDVLRRIIELLQEDTLLVVLGDHGMDEKGNHGGDSNLETAAALWLYSKGPPLTHPQADTKLVESWPTYTFPGSSAPLRHVNQIDLVPTLALLLGIPIPYNNLGSVIPECFAGDLGTLELATRTNAEQISRYLEAYGDDAIRRALSAVSTKAQAAAEAVQKVEPALAPADKVAATGGKVTDWLRARHQEPKGEAVEDVKQTQALHHSIITHRHYSLEALRHLRALWAQFSLPLILLGSLILGLSVLTLVALYVGVRNNGVNWDVYVRLALETAGMASAVVASIVGTVAGVYTRQPAVALKTFAVVIAIVSEVVLIAPLFIKVSLPRTFSINRYVGPFLLFVHAVSFASNSFIMWEDRLVLFLLVTIPLIYTIKAFSAPTASMRIQVVLFSLAFAAIVRLVATVTVCREEQQPYCRVTFYSGSTSTAHGYVLLAIIPLGLQLPRALGITLAKSKSLAGPAPFILGILWRGVLVANALYWVLEWLESYDNLQPERIPLVSLTKMWIARISAGTTLGALPYIWATSPLCISVQRESGANGESEQGQGQVTVFGFANAYGSTYILFLLIPFALVHLVTQPMGQITLSAVLCSLLLYLELVDVRRDAIILQQSFAASTQSQGGQPGAFDPSSGDLQQLIVRPSFTDVVPLVLSGFLGFFATGHQAVIPSIQWKSAFVGFETVTYPFSPLSVALNTFGSIFLSAISIPLLSIWNQSPKPKASLPVLGHTLQLSLAFLVYHTTITFTSSIFSAYLRRHLMVWKVFAPRFMLSAMTLLVVDLGLIIALTIGFRLTAWKVRETFACQSV